MESMNEVAIVVGGNVDSGKSSLIGVLINDVLDDGNGSARSSVMKHPHEKESGRTSDISEKHFIGNGHIISLVDLCGHEKYFGTTSFGITGYFPDYGIIVISANDGILKMTKEHLGLLMCLKIPLIICITHIDITPKNIYIKTLKSIKRLENMIQFSKHVIFMNSLDKLSEGNVDITLEEKINIEKIADDLQTNNDIIPVFSISNKTGYHIKHLKHLLINLKVKNIEKDESNSIFYIDTVFNPIGIGIVVTGILKGRTIHQGDILYLGPINKEYIIVRVKSIHNNVRQIISHLNNHERGCLAIAPIRSELKRGMIHKGMVIVDDYEIFKTNVAYHFKAHIEIMKHSTTIKSNYSPVIHCHTIKQTARIITQHELQTGNKEIVEFKFKYKPAFLEIGSIFFFREGCTRGIGKILEITPIEKDDDPNPDLK